MNSTVNQNGIGREAMGSDVMTLNVGGTIYNTTRATLTKYPDSMLGAMFGGQFIPCPLDEEGRYFIDRDGSAFRHVLNFLRSGHLSLPQGFTDHQLLETEADFYQIPPLIAAVKLLNTPEKPKAGFYVEVMDFEETAYFSRFYSDPPRGINAELKSGGMVVTGPRVVLQTLPLPEKAMKDLETSDAPYRTVNIGTCSSAHCSKMAVNHYLQNSGWQLAQTSFANTSDSDGSYMVHKYIWFLPDS